MTAARRWIAHLSYLTLAAIFLIASHVTSTTRAEQSDRSLSGGELAQLVAPIALYPDTLLSQVLMASTYPLEVVAAARWVQANPKVTGDAAVKAVEKQS